MDRIHELMIRDINDNLRKHLSSLEAQFIEEIKGIDDEELIYKQASILNSIYLDACCMSDSQDRLNLYSLMISKILEMEEEEQMLFDWQKVFMQHVSRYTNYIDWLTYLELKTVGEIYNYCL